MKLPLKTINRDQFFITALGIALSLLFLGFCVLTSNQGFERRYLDSDIPFVYQLNNSIPLEWIPVINTSADSWTDLESCYWVFEAGPLLPDEEVKSPVELMNVPAAALVTSTLIVPVAPAAREPPTKLMDVAPAAAANVPPVSVDEALGVAAITTPAGKLSVKLKFVAASADALLSTVNVSVVISPCPIVAGEKVAPNVGGGSITKFALLAKATTPVAFCTSEVVIG